MTKQEEMLIALDKAIECAVEAKKDAPYHERRRLIKDVIEYGEMALMALDSTKGK